MADNRQAQMRYSQGDHITIALDGSDFDPGDVVVQGQLVGVCLSSDDDSTTLALKGSFEVPKTNQAMSLGAKVYWDSNGGQGSASSGDGAATTTSSGNTFMGYAVSVEAAGDNTVEVLLARPGS